MGPLVSVVIPTYNQAWCIKETISSVLNQTYRNIEVIVVDDASIDETPERIAAFGRRVIYIRHDTNHGLKLGAIAYARNNGLARAQGEFIAFLDGDDLWDPEKLAVQVDAAQRNPRSGLIAVDGVRFDDLTGIILSDTLLWCQPAAELEENGMLTARLYEHFLRYNVIATPSQVMVPRWTLDAIGLFEPFPGGSDYDLWLRIAASYDLTFVKQRLTKWRYRPTNNTGPLHMARFRFAQANVTIWKKHLRVADQQYRPTIQARIREELAVVSESAIERAHHGERDWVARYLWNLLRHNPTSLTVAAFFASLWVPRRLTKRLSPFVRRIIGVS